MKSVCIRFKAFHVCMSLDDIPGLSLLGHLFFYCLVLEMPFYVDKTFSIYTSIRRRVILHLKGVKCQLYIGAPEA